MTTFKQRIEAALLIKGVTSQREQQVFDKSEKTLARKKEDPLNMKVGDLLRFALLGQVSATELLPILARVPHADEDWLADYPLDHQPIPAQFGGWQENPDGPPFELWTLTVTIPGHPCHSALTRDGHTAEGAHVAPPPPLPEGDS